MASFARLAARAVEIVGEAHKILDRVFVGAAGAGVTEIGEPFDLGRHVGEAMKLGGGEKPGCWDDCGRELVGGVVGRAGHLPPVFPLILLLIKSVIKSKFVP